MNKFKNWVPSNLKRKAPEELTPQDLKSIWMDMADKGKADQTIVHVLSLIGRVINWGNEMALCPQLSFKIKKPKVNNEVTEMMTEEQLKNYLSALDQAPLDVADQLRLMLYSGLRRTEVFKLEWSHIDFSKRQIKLVSTKSGGDQIIPMNKLTEGVLRRQLRGIDTPYVFPKPDGSRYYKRYKEFRAVREAAGLPKTFRPCHGLRHTFASELASSGKVDLYTLQKLLRHSTPVMTQRYAHLRDEALKRGAGVADDMFSDKEESRRERKWT
jgi:integrase